MVGWVSEEIFVYSVHEGVIGVIGVWIVLIRRKGRRRAWLGAEGGKEALRQCQTRSLGPFGRIKYHRLAG